MTNGGDEQTNRDRETGRILLIGDIRRAFLNTNAVNGSRYEVCTDVEEAIDVAATNRFAAIAVVISAFGAKLNTTLRSLKELCDAKIILLAQMYEEPTAIQLVNAAHNGAKLAQDYLICPVQPDTLYESVMAPDRRSPQRPGYVGIERPEPSPEQLTELQISPPVEKTVEARIRHLERLATEDDLTGLKNRRYIREFARQIIEHAKKENGQVTLLVFDIDNFKRYNDLYGHATGDDILKQAAALVRRCCRSHDVVGRIGGDEFAVVFWDDPNQTPVEKKERRSSADHPTEVISIAKRFIKELESAELSSFDGLGPEGKGVLTISGGLAGFPRDGQTSDDLFKQADKALLEAKRSGKNRIYLVGKPAPQGNPAPQSAENSIADIEE